MPTALTLDANVNLNLKQAEAQWKRFEQTTSNRTSQGGFSALTKQAKDFDKQLGQVTNRVVAFGTAFGALSIIERSFTTFIKSTIDIEQGLARINVNLGESAEGLKKFSSGLFNAARETGSSFDDAAKAAEELARQGLSAEDTLKRLKNALTLSRIAGLSQAEAVETLTAALNSFNKSALTSSEVLNKFVAVDTNFAVSSKDLAEGVSRVGATAQAAGVGIDQLIGLITSLQQTTARGGTTIGNGLKTIFTRLQANPETVTALESVGVAIKDTSGNLRSAIDILQDYAVARTKVGDAEKVALDRTISGTQQINVLKAALTDLSKENSIYASAVKTSTNATDEAIRKNEELNKTLASLLNSTEVSFKQLFASIGSQKAAPFFKELLQSADEARKYFSGESGTALGEALGDGIIKGLSNVITGPAFITAAALIGKILIKVFGSIQQDISQLLNINTVAAQRAKVQERIVDLLGLANAAEQKQYQLASSTLEKKQALLAIQERLTIESNIGTGIQNAFIGGASLGRTKIRGISTLRGIGRADAPNFADPLGAAIGREQAAGLSKSQIYVDRDPRIANFANPLGLLVANTRDEPMGGYQGVNRVLAQGGDPKRSGIANFADPFVVGPGQGGVRYNRGAFVDKQTVDSINKLVSSLNGLDSNSIKSVATQLRNLAKGFDDSTRNAITNRILNAQRAARATFEANRSNGVGNGIDESGTFVFKNTNKSLGINSVRDGLDYTRRQRRQFREAALYKQDLINDAIGGPGDSLISASVGYDTAQPGIQARNERLRQAKLKADYRKATVEQNRIARQESIRAQNDRLEDLRPQLQEDAYLTNQRDINDRFTKSQRRRGRILTKAAQTRDRNNRAAFGASFILPFLAGGVEPLFEAGGFSTKGGTGTGQFAGALTGAANGAGIGGIFGPIGLGVGALVGAMVGAAGKINKSASEISEELDKAASDRGKENDAIAHAISLREQLNDARKEGAPASVVKSLTNQLSAAVSGVTSEVGKRILGTSGSEQDTLREKKRQADAVQESYRGATENLAGGRTDNLADIFGGGLNGNADFVNSLSSKDKAALGRAGSLNTDAANQDFASGRSTKVGKQQLDEFNTALKDVTPIIGKFVDVTQVNTANVQKVIQAFVKAFNVAIKGVEETAKNPPSLGFTKTQLLNKPNLDVTRQAALTGRNPFATRSIRARTQLDFYNELIGQGVLSKEALEGVPEYQKARAETQASNLDEYAISLIQTNNPNVGGLRDARGNPNRTGIQRQLGFTANAGVRNSGIFKTLQDLYKRIEPTLNEAGVGSYVSQGENTALPGQTANVGSGLVAGTKYSTTAGDSLNAVREAQKAFDKTVDAVNKSVVRAVLQVDGTVKVTSEILGSQQLTDLAAELTAAVGKHYDAQIQAVNNRISALAGTPQPPTPVQTNSALGSRNSFVKGADGFIRQATP